MYKDPNLPDIDLPIVAYCQASVFDFKGSQNLSHFAARKEWYTATFVVIKYFSKKGMARDPSLDFDTLNSIDADFPGKNIFTTIILVR